MTDTISVIIPVYNVEKYINKTLKSLCSQTYQNLQIILIDDGSTDDSLQICQKWAEQDKRIQILTQKNNGVSYTRNRGIREASGKYIMFLDADDWIEADMLEQLYIQAEAHNADVAVCTIQEENPESISEEQIPFTAEKKNVRIVASDDKIESGLALLTVWGPVCKLYRKNIVENIVFENYKIAEDVLFNTNVICSDTFQRAVVIYHPFYHYIIYPGSAMKQQFQQKYLEAMYVELECYEKLTALSPAFGDINLIGCSVSRVFEKYAQLPRREKKRYKKEFLECKKFARKHKDALIKSENMHRRISGMLKVYIPDIYMMTLSFRYKKH